MTGKNSSTNDLFGAAVVLASRLADEIDETRRDWEEGRVVETLAGILSALVAISILQKDLSELARRIKSQNNGEGVDRVE